MVRLSARGDVVFSSAMIPALRRTYPDARITWVVEESAQDYVRHNPRLDRVLVLPRRTSVRELRQGRVVEATGRLGAFLGELRSWDYDVALDLQGLMKSALVAYLSGARVRIGLGAAEGSRLLHHRVIPRTGHGYVRPSSEYFHLARTLGLDTGDFAMDVVLGPEDEAGADTALAAAGVEPGEFVALVPFTTRPQKHWFEERWAALAEAIPGATGLRPLVLGGPDDVPAMERIRARVGSSVVDLVGRTRLGQAAGVLRRARAVVGVDTGFTHLSLAFQRPTVALFGSTRPYQVTPGVTSRILFRDMACAPCRKHPTCGGDWTCMRRLDVEEVMEALNGVLDQSQGGRG